MILYLPIYTCIYTCIYTTEVHTCPHISTLTCVMFISMHIHAFMCGPYYCIYTHIHTYILIGISGYV